jgi:hypothetical protein
MNGIHEESLLTTETSVLSFKIDFETSSVSFFHAFGKLSNFASVGKKFLITRMIPEKVSIIVSLHCLLAVFRV